jgi:hypothetical protein
MSTDSVFLCHKCAGHLTNDAGPSAYACSCMSSYVRDWQRPTPASDVRTIQLAECLDRAKLYTGQKRSDNDSSVVANLRNLMKLGAGLTTREVVRVYHAGLCSADEAVAAMVAQGMYEIDAALELAYAVPDDVWDGSFLDITAGSPIRPTNDDDWTGA